MRTESPWDRPGVEPELSSNVLSTDCGVRRVGGIHTLRHCFASHALVDGHDIFDIKRWMGHGALKTTGRYLHVVPGSRTTVVSPLDTLYHEA